MKLSVLIDPLHKLKPYKDTTLAIIASAQKMGWECTYFTPNDIFCSDEQAFANVSHIKILNLEHATNWAQTHSLGIKPLHEFDIILMRKDPPFDMEYIYYTYALELAEKKGVLVANKPQSLRDTNEKFFILNFKQCIPATIVTRDIQKLHEFWEKEKEIILKPLDGMGGQSIFYVGKDGQNISVILETLTKNSTLSIMAQKYVPEVKKEGDKRILIIDGKPIAYALARFPQKGERRGNLAVGGRGEIVKLTDRDYWLCQQLEPCLKEKGLYFVGLDVIGKYITEINVTSPTCLVEIAKATNIDIATQFLKSLASIRKAQLS